MAMVFGRVMSLWCVKTLAKLRNRKLVFVFTALVIMVPGMVLRQRIANIFTDHSRYTNRLVRRFIISDDDNYFGFPKSFVEKSRADVHRSRRAQENMADLRRPKSEINSGFGSNRMTNVGMKFFHIKQSQEGAEGLTTVDSKKKHNHLEYDSSMQLDNGNTKPGILQTNHTNEKEDNIKSPRSEQVKQYRNNANNIDKSEKGPNERIRDVQASTNGDYWGYNRWRKLKQRFFEIHRKNRKQSRLDGKTVQPTEFKTSGENEESVNNVLEHFANNIDDLSSITAKELREEVTEDIKADLFFNKISNESSENLLSNSPTLSKKKFSELLGEGEVFRDSDFNNISEYRDEDESTRESFKRNFIVKKVPAADLTSHTNHHIETSRRGESHFTDFNSIGSAPKDSVNTVGYEFHKHPAHRIGCSGVLERAVVGKWIPRRYAQSELDAVQNFIKKTRDTLGLPPSLQRPDKKCGNVSFGEYKFGDKITYRWFRALCNPEGKSPCCRDNRCVPGTVEQCTCDGCLDMRQQIHAELAIWVPSDKECQLRRYEPGEETCKALDGFKVHFVGDSLLRQIFVAMLRLLQVTGKKLTTKDEMNRCKGYFSYLPYCSKHLPFAVKTCGGKVVVKRSYLTRNSDTAEIITEIRQYAGQRDSLLVLGLGMHDHLNSKLILETVVNPILASAATFNSSWPRLVWVAPHAPGLLKSPWLPSQLAPSILNFNKQVNAAFAFAKIHVLDTFGLTKDGVMTYDGLHYGEGVNTLKADILLNYIQEIRKNDETEEN